MTYLYKHFVSVMTEVLDELSLVCIIEIGFQVIYCRFLKLAELLLDLEL